MNNKKNGKFSTGPIQGENIILELTVPEKVQENLRLQIGEVIHGFKNLFLESVGYGTSGSCNINIICRLNWEDESDAIARLINGIYYGSGSLVNNTANDYTPYFLTAFHNIDVNLSGSLSTSEIEALSSCHFQFQYKSSNCDPSSNSGYLEYNGADLISHWDSTDFILLELDDSPVGNGEITYLGWDNRNNSPSSVVCIHHPSGDVMKYSYDGESPTLELDNTHWFIDDWEEGTTEGGSSGSPLFDQNSRVIGQDHMGDGEDPCDVDKGTYFGCFHESWDGDGTNDNQLAHWLDPNSTGNPTTNLLRSPSLTVPDIICYDTITVSIQNPPPGKTITWGGTNVTYPYGNTGTSVPVKAVPAASGTGTVTASFTINNIPYTITHPLKTGVPNYNLLDIDLEGGELIACDYTSATADYDGTAAIDAYEWNIPNASDWDIEEESGTGPDNKYVEIDYWEDPPPYYEDIYIRAHNTCGWSDWQETSWPVTDNCGYRLMLFSPNPTTGETTLTIQSSSEKEILDVNQEWDLEVYTQTQVLKAKKTRLKGSSTVINTAGWQEGVYVVRVLYNNEVITGKLIVKR